MGEASTNDDYRDRVVAFDATLEEENEETSQLFICGTNEKFDVFYLS